MSSAFRRFEILLLSLLAAVGCGRQHSKPDGRAVGIRAAGSGTWPFPVPQPDHAPRLVGPLPAKDFEPLPAQEYRLSTSLCGLVAAARVGPLHAIPWICLKADDLMLDGIYGMCGEVAPFMGETIELSYGRCRYWVYSDVKFGDEPAYPLVGTYTVANDRLLLRLPGNRFAKLDSRTIGQVNGIRVLWRDDGLALWKEKREIHPYSVLLQVGTMMEAQNPFGRPSIERLTRLSKRP